ncbi:hypothetical protein DXG01_010127 [Tephrocybe rancida]|nr:hypothetical protein DXG01_010127 [Tephrocybe rancida]
MTRTIDVDPLTLAMAPPPGETIAERLAREEQEERARQVSKHIDHELKLAKAAMRSMQRAVKVLVLGQSMSDFQMTYAQKSWADERDSWKAVILLNLARSINVVASIISEEISNSRAVSPTDKGSHRVGLTEHHRNLVLKLVPLRQIQQDLETLIGSGSSEGDATYNLQRGSQEFVLRSSTGWKTVLDHIRNPRGGKELQLQRVASEVIVSLKDDIHELWNDAAVRNTLQRRKLRLEDTPGFFLNDLDRLASPDYIPSDADVVRARLRTTGVQEYHFHLDRGTPTARDWMMYDVAGV